MIVGFFCLSIRQFAGNNQNKAKCKPIRLLCFGRVRVFFSQFFSGQIHCIQDSAYNMVSGKIVFALKLISLLLYKACGEGRLVAIELKPKKYSFFRG